MPDFLSRLFSSDGFMPHGHCYLWNPGLIWLHVISDGLIALAYTSIPFTLLHLARKRRDIPFNWMFACFGTFIVACGATHVMEIWTLWTPTYWLSGVVKAITAAASVSTAALLVTLVPKAVAIPTAQELAKAHEELQRAHEVLESRIQERTAELTRKNEELAREIVERRRAEDAHELDVRFRALLDTAPDAMVVVGDDGQINLVNLRTEELFGYTRAELMGQNLEVLIPERLRAGHRGHLSKFFTNPGARPMGSGLELFGRRKDGTELPIEVSLSPLQTDGRLTVSAAIRDISLRKHAEAAAKLTAQRLVSAVESIQDAFALFDHDGRLVLCNSTYRRLLRNASLGAVVGKSYEELLDGWLDDVSFADEAERARFRAARLQQIQEQTNTVDVRMKDGRSLRITDRRTPESGLVKTIWDVTDDVRLAEELREARVAADAANGAKSQFVASMSHEIRTPLNAILGFAQLLQRDKREPITDRHRERVAQILKGGEHLLRLIDDILDLSRIEAGGVSISPEPVNVLEALNGVRETLETMAARNGIRVELEVSLEDSPTVTADRTRFLQILMNLGSNAIKYNRPAGRVTFMVSRPTPESVRVTVRDTGAGIPVDKQEKLFQPFQRAGQETGPIEGTGIGLVITKRLAQLMGGDVGFRSTVGEGSEFWVDLPAQGSRRASSGPPSLPSRTDSLARGATGSGLILYVEDNPANVRFMRDVVSVFDNVELITASSAEMGLELARNRRPSAIIMDINLPGMSGLDALRGLRSAPETAKIPVIAMTAAASERDRKHGVQAGFYRYLTKPVNVDELVVALEGLLGAPAS